MIPNPNVVVQSWNRSRKEFKQKISWCANLVPQPIILFIDATYFSSDKYYSDATFFEQSSKCERFPTMFCKFVFMIFGSVYVIVHAGFGRAKGLPIESHSRANVWYIVKHSNRNTNTDYLLPNHSSLLLFIWTSRSFLINYFLRHQNMNNFVFQLSQVNSYFLIPSFSTENLILFIHKPARQ